MNLKKLFKRDVLRKDTRNCIISKKLSDELWRTKEMLESLYYKKYKLKRKISIVKTSKLLADICQNERLKIKNGKKLI